MFFGNIVQLIDCHTKKGYSRSILSLQALTIHRR